MFVPSLSAVSQLASAATMTSVAYLLLAVGFIALLLSSYRYVLTYLVGGMLYGLVVEIIQSGLVHTFEMGTWYGYIAALGLTWLIAAWVIYRLPLDDHEQPTKPEVDRYIEHTPIYNNYRPRFPN